MEKKIYKLGIISILFIIVILLFSNINYAEEKYVYWNSSIENLKNISKGEVENVGIVEFNDTATTGKYITDYSHMIYIGKAEKEDSVVAYFKDNKLIIQFEGKLKLSKANMFEGWTDLTSIQGLEFVDTSDVTDMSYMFYGCTALTQLNLSKFNTSNVTNMSHMFCGCSSLTNLDLSSFDTSNVTDMNSMFGGCSSLTNLDLSSFDTSNVSKMAFMFNRCSSLTQLELNNFNVDNVSDFIGIFDECTSLNKLYASISLEKLANKEIEIFARL